MIDIVRKRHEGDGWIVFTELANSTGFGAHRFADAFALGVWESTKHEGHLYEFKASRGDLRRELMDPKKAQGVGKYATYWWLVLEDEKIAADLVIPDSWGIIVPTIRGGTRIGKVIRKAPKQKPAAFDPKFAIAMIRNIAKSWVSRVDHETVRNQLDDALALRDVRPPPGQRENENKIYELERELKQLREGLSAFKEATGVDLTDKTGWALGHIGQEFQIARELNRKVVAGELGDHVSRLSQFAETLLGQVESVAQAAVELRGLLGRRVCKPPCRSTSEWGRGQCSCGAQALSEVERRLQRDADIADVSEDRLEEVATALGADDDERGAIDRGGARPPQ